MASCFKNPNNKYLSAKDYTIKKRRTNLFCDLRNIALNNVENGILSNSANNEACIDKSGIFFKYRNNQLQLDMLAAYQNYRNDLVDRVQGQLFKQHFCPPYFIDNSNNNVKNNYNYDNIQLAYGNGAGYGHLTDYFGAQNQGIVSVSTLEYRNKYAEIKRVDSDLGGDLLGGFKNNKFFLLKPPVCDNKERPQVLKAGDFPAPIPTVINILIE